MTDTPRQTEPSVNNALGGLLQGMLPGREVRAEHTGAIAERRGLQPDVLITAAGRSPVVIEAEYEPAANVEAEATSRLGREATVVSRRLEAAIALRYPDRLHYADNLDSELRDASLSYCLFTEERDGLKRFPESGWLDGSVEDIADLVRLASLPQRAVDEASDALEKGIDGAERRLAETAELRPATAQAVAGLLRMTNVRQTRRMACAIIANALIFHERLAGMYPGVKPLNLVCGEAVANPQNEVLAAWTRILEINYWPIFAIAKDILEQLPAGDAAGILSRLRLTAQTVNAAGVDNSHDLTGRVFQRLIADRKYLATFYTLPASAALLARLAVAKLQGVDWSDPEAIGRLRIADFACGTGTLLSAVYEQVAARHDRTGGSPADLHRVMMEEVLYGCDVIPSAVHITGSTLSGVEPGIGFRNSRLYTLPYGRQPDGSVKIGSLELLQTSAAMTLFNTSDPGQRTGSAGEQTATQIIADIPDEGYDLVIMNPPFTRNVTREGAYADTIAAAFAAFDASDEDQRQMARRMAILKKGTCYHGNAGVASAFAALAHRKLKRGGVLALVLPLSAASGLSWQGFRRMLLSRYTTVTVLSIAASGNDDLSFSADTGMAECLVIARKLKLGETSGEPIRFTSLVRRSQGLVHAGVVASGILSSNEVRGVEDGPWGGTPLYVGDELTGGMLTDHSYSVSEGDGWKEVRLSDYSLAQTAHALSNSQLWLPGTPSALGLDLASLGFVGKFGMYHLDIIGAPPRGPFSKVAPSPTATYPSLWNHNAKNETRIVCAPDSQLQVRQGMEAKAIAIWQTASRSHLNLDYRFNSQPLAAAFTENDSIGGRAWPNVRFDDRQFEYAFVIWANSTLGLLSFWWHSNRQVAGRGTTTITGISALPVLNFRELSDDQLVMAELIFDEFRDKELKPAYLADIDPNRGLLDRRVVCDLLGFDESVYGAVRRLAAKWCAEPSVHGGKQRPKGASLII